MQVTTIKRSGKVSAEVRNASGHVLYRSPKYVTERMAVADARCWMAFNKEEDVKEETVWVPVSRGYEVELPWSTVTKIVWDYSAVMSLRRQYRTYDAVRAAKPLKEWLKANDLDLSAGDMAEIVHWWHREGTHIAAERGRKAVEAARRAG